MNLWQPTTKDTLIFEGNYLLMQMKNRKIGNNDEIQYSGIVRNQLTLSWKMLTDSIVPNDVLASDPRTLVSLGANSEQMGQVIAVKKLNPLPITSIVRGYCVPSSSSWNSYKSIRKICGVELPDLMESEILPSPIFTPKYSDGKNISYDEMKMLVTIALGYNVEFASNICEGVKNISMRLYEFAHNFALDRGLIIADTAFHFALDSDKNLVLIGELLTPTTSRFWGTSSYKSGEWQKTLCNINDHIHSLGLDENTDTAVLSQDISEKLSKEYCEIYSKLFGLKIEELIKTLSIQWGYYSV